jgi:hypothetical protein
LATNTCQVREIKKWEAWNWILHDPVANRLAFPIRLKWEASFQECQPIALGPLGTLDGTLGFFDFFPKLLSP